MTGEQRFAHIVLFEKLGTTAFGDCFRAGRVLGSVVEAHVLLQLFNGTSLKGEPFWQLVADRQSLVETLEDPHLGDSIAFNRVDSTAFAAYAYAPGRSLDVFLTAVRDQNLPVPVDQALFIIERAALGLTAAHGVIHRGRPVLHGFLVPELIHLSSEGEIRVLGIEAAPGLRSQLAAHPAFGAYVAPEVRAGEAPTESDDVFSLGALLFHLLCGVALPPEPSESVAATLEGATLAAGGEPLPPDITNLLQSSLAPRASRIPDAVTWQQMLGKILLDGEHNPTTFNLSFLMHTIFRQDLEAELVKIPQELALRLTPPPAVETDDPVADEDEIVSPLPGRTIEEVRRPFVTGFVLSFFSAAVFVAAYFVFFHTPGEADTGDLPLSPVVAEALSASSSFSSVVGSVISETETVQNLHTDEVSGNGDPAIVDPAETSAEKMEAQLQQLLTSSRADLEASLRAEYEQRIIELERQLATDNQPASTASSADPVEPQLLTEIDDDFIPADETSPASDPIVAVDDTRPLDDSAALESDQSQGQPAVTDPPPRTGIEATPIETASAVPSQTPTIEDKSEDEPLDFRESGREDDPSTSSAMVFEPPRLQTPPRPKYPSAARRLRRAATVRVRVLVDATGRVSETQLPGPEAGFGFDGAAEAAAQRSQWTPATRNGEPVDSWALLTIEFQP